MTGYYIKGKMTGLWKMYYENGNIKQEGHFKEGKGHGLWKFYNENGELIRNSELKTDY